MRAVDELKKKKKKKKKKKTTTKTERKERKREENERKRKEVEVEGGGRGGGRSGWSAYNPADSPPLQSETSVAYWTVILMGPRANGQPHVPAD